MLLFEAAYSAFMVHFIRLRVPWESFFYSADNKEKCICSSQKV